jgi:ADP-heptose:LPS heptosyltransferase
MGLGGYLTWTAVAREVRARLGKDVKILPIEQHGNFVKLIKSPIFHNNEDFVQEWAGDQFTFPLVFNNQKANYCKSDTQEKAVHRYDKHIIEQICEVYGIKDPLLKCVISLDTKEKEEVDRIVGILPPSFVTIDVGVNKEYTQNKFDNIEFWQKLVDNLSPKIKFVQVGTPDDRRLNGVISLLGRTTFRTAAGVIGRSKLFVGPEGGLVHAASAFDTKCVVIVSSFIHPDLVKYQDNVYIWANEDKHGPCGMKINCEYCKKNMLTLNIKDVCNTIKNLL